MSIVIGRPRGFDPLFHRVLFGVLAAGLGLRDTRAADPSPAQSATVTGSTVYYRVAHTVEYSGPESQFRTQTTSHSECISRKGGQVAEYDLSAHAATLVGRHKHPIGAKFKPLLIRRDPGTEALTVARGPMPLEIGVMNRVMSQVGRGGRGAGAWEHDLELGISRYMPDRIRLKFSAVSLDMKGVPDALSLAVVSEPFSFEALDASGPKTVTGLFRAVFIYSTSQDRLVQMGATLSAHRGDEAMRVDFMALQIDAEGNAILAPVADLSEFLGSPKAALSVNREAPPPFWTRQACQAFQTVAMAAATAGHRATNWTLIVAQAVNAVDSLWGAAATVVETVGSTTGIETVEAWGKAMDATTPSKEIERQLAQVIGAQEAEYAMATVQLGAAFVGGAVVTSLGPAATAVGVGMAFHTYAVMPVMDAFWANEERESIERFEKALARVTQWETVDPPYHPIPPDLAGAGTQQSRSWAVERVSRVKELAQAHPYVAGGAALGTVALVVGLSGGGGGGGGSGGSSALAGSWSTNLSGTFVMHANGTFTVEDLSGTYSVSGNSFSAVSRPWSGGNNCRGYTTLSGTINDERNRINGTMQTHITSGSCRGVTEPLTMTKVN